MYLSILIDRSGSNSSAFCCNSGQIDIYISKNKINSISHQVVKRFQWLQQQLEMQLRTSESMSFPINTCMCELRNKQWDAISHIQDLNT